MEITSLIIGIITLFLTSYIVKDIYEKNNTNIKVSKNQLESELRKLINEFQFFFMEITSIKEFNDPLCHQLFNYSMNIEISIQKIESLIIKISDNKSDILTVINPLIPSMNKTIMALKNKPEILSIDEIHNITNDSNTKIELMEKIIKYEKNKRENIQTLLDIHKSLHRNIPEFKKK